MHCWHFTAEPDELRVTNVDENKCVLSFLHQLTTDSNVALPAWLLLSGRCGLLLISMALSSKPIAAANDGPSWDGRYRLPSSKPTAVECGSQ